MATNLNNLDLSSIGISCDKTKNSFDTSQKDPEIWDWRSKNGDELIKDARFMSRLRDYYGTGKDAWGFYDIEDDEDLIDVFLRDRYLKNWNTAGASYELGKVNTNATNTFSGLSNEQENDTIEMMQHAYETMGNFWNDETGRSWMRFRNLAGNMILDPLNVIGFGAGAKVGANAYRVARLAGTGKKAAKAKASWAGAKKGAVVEGLVGFPAGATMDLIVQARNKSIGLQDEIYQKNLLLSGLIGGAAGFGLGGLFGAAGGRFGARGAGKIKDRRYQASSQYGDLQGNLTNLEFDAALKGRDEGTTLQLPDQQPGRKLIEEAKAAQSLINDMRVNPADYSTEEVSSAIQRLATIKAILELPKSIDDIKAKIAETTDPDQRIALEEKLNIYKTAHKKALESRTVDEVDAALEIINPALKKAETETPDVITLGDGTTPKADADAKPEADAKPKAETTGQRILTDDEAIDFYNTLTEAWKPVDGGVSGSELATYWRQKIVNLDESIISKENKQKLLDVHDEEVKAHQWYEEEIGFEDSDALLAVKSKGGRPKKLDLSRLSHEEKLEFHEKVNDYMIKYKRGHPQASNYILRQAEREYSEFALERLITQGVQNRTVRSNIGKFSGDNPENPLPEGAGRIIEEGPSQTKVLGKTQSFLRKGGSGGQFIGKTPIKSKIDLYKVQAIAEHKKIRGPIRFIWNGRKALKTADGDEIKKGGTAFYIDNPEPGILGKVYKHIENITQEKPIPVESVKVADIKPGDPNIQLMRVLQKKIDAGKGSDEDITKLTALKAKYGDVTTKTKKASPESTWNELLKSTDTEVQSLLTQLRDKLGKPAKASEPVSTKTKTKAEAIVDENAVEIPDGMVAALRNKKDPNNIRVQSIKQKDAGLNVSAIAGRSKLEDWDIGFVPEGMRGSDALDNFKPLQKESIPDVDVVIKESFESKGKPVAIKSHYGNKELSEIDIDISDLTSPDGKKSLADYFDSQTQNSLFSGNPDKRITADMGWRIADILEGQSYDKWANNSEYLADTLHKLYARLPERKPNTQTREAAIKQVQKIMSNASDEELAIVERMFNAMDIEMFPIFRNWQDISGNVPIDPTIAQGATIAPGIKMEGAGDIAINPARTGDFDPELNIKERDIAEQQASVEHVETGAWNNIPDRHAPSMMIAHEFAHWSYFNILDSKDKATFHKAIQKYISETPNPKNGRKQMDWNALMQKSYDADGYMGIGALHSPQEFFANQFVLWVNGRKNVVGSDNYWASIYRKVKAMFNRLSNSEEALDPDLVPIFNKLLPEEKVITKSTAKSTNPISDIIQQQTWSMRLLNDDLTSAVHGTQDPVLTYNYLADLVRELTLIESQGAINKKAYDAEFLNLIGVTRDTVETKLKNIKSFQKNDFSMIELGESSDLVTFANDLSPTINDIISTLEHSFGRANQTADAIPTINTNLLKESPKIKTNEELTTKQKLATKIRRKRKADEKLLDRKVSQIKKNVKNVKQAELDEADISNPRIMEHSTLKQKFKDADPNSVEGIAYGKELYRRLITKLPKPKTTDISREIMSMRKDDLISELHKSLNNKEQGKSRFQQVYAEIYRRQIAKNSKKGIFTVGNERLVQAIRSESEEMIDLIDAGIHPVGVKQQKKQLLIKSTHRNPEVQGELRTFMNKLVLLHGGNVNYTKGGTFKQPKLKSRTLNEADRDFTTYVAGMQFETNAADFKVLRKLGRSIAIEIVKDDPNVDKLMNMINEAIMTTSYIDTYQRKIISRLFTAQPTHMKDADGKIVPNEHSKKYPRGKDGLDIDDDIVSEQWFIDTMVKLQKGEIAYSEIIDPKLGDILEVSDQAIQDVITNMNEAASWFVNGSLKSKKAKEKLMRLSLYGDPYANLYKDLPMLNENAGVNSPIPVYVAKTVARQKINSILSDPKKALNILNFIGHSAFDQPNLKVYYHGTPHGSSLSKKANPDIMMEHSGGIYGPGFYITDEPEVAGAFGGTNATREAKYSLADRHGEEGAFDISLYMEARKEFDTLYSMGRKIDDEFKTENTLKIWSDQMADLNAEADRLFKKYGYQPEPTVLPVFARLTQGFDIREGAEGWSTWNKQYMATNMELKRIVDKAEEKGLIDPSGIMHMFEDPYEAISQHDFYVRMIKLLNDDWDDTKAWHQQDLQLGKRRFNSLLQSLGYDHMIHSQPQINKTTGQYVVGDAYNILNHGHVKHVDSKFFDSNSLKLYDEEMGAGSIAGSLLDVAQIDGALYVRRKLNGLHHALEESGLPPELINTLNDMADGEITASSIKNTRKLSFTGILRNNSNRSRIESNSNWFSDWVAPLEGTGHYERHNAIAGDKFVPIIQMLNNLPDAPRWYERYAYKFKVWGDVPQPESHKKILRALRYALDPEHRSVKSLTRDERLVAEKINQFFKDEHHWLIDSGVEMGEIKNYVPRVYDAEAIKKDLPGFVDRISAYLMREAAEDSRRLSVSQATEKAKAIAMRITDDDGSYIPPFAEKKSPHSDNIDFQRMLKLSGKELEALEPYLINDLTSVLSKYIDGSTRRGLFTQKWGYNNFGFDDYMRVGIEGVDGIAKMLQSNKIAKVTLRYATDGGGMDEVTTPIPKLNVPRMFDDNPSQARLYANHVVDLVSKGKKAEAKAKLMEFAAESGDQWEHRVNGIVEGLHDFGDTGGLTPKQVKVLLGQFRVLQRKPLDSSGTFYEKASVTSKLLRNINAITLLSYTTLTSIPDVFLPLLRGGSMKSFIKGWKKFATDKHYREMLSRTGLNIENINHDRLAGMYGSAGGRSANNFFHVTLLSQWTDTMRKIGGGVGFETMRTMNRIAADLWRADGKMSVKYRTAARILRQFGLEDYAKPDPETGRFKMVGEMGEMMAGGDSMRFREAMIKFANETIFAPNPNDNPLWSQTPIGSLVYQLKSFPVMMGKLTWNIFKEAKQGNLAPLVYFFTIGTGLGGAGSLAVKDIVQMRGGEEGNKAALRERLFVTIAKDFGFKSDRNKTIEGWEKNISAYIKDHPEMVAIALAAGYKPSMHGSIDSFMGWYIESLLQTGGLGMMGELLYNTASQADNGAYGFQRIMSYLAGPSYDTVGVQGYNILAGGQEFISDKGGGDVTNAKRRSLIRGLLNRVPFLGGNRAFREKGTNMLAGDAQDNGRKSAYSGYSGSYGSGY